MKYSGICLVTADVRRLVSFYETLFETQAEGDGWHAELHFAGLNMAIFDCRGMEEMAPGSTVGSGVGSVILEFEVADVDALFERIQPLGVRVVKPPQSHPWGSRAFWIRDLDGNLLDFYSRIPPAS